MITKFYVPKPRYSSITSSHMMLSKSYMMLSTTSSPCPWVLLKAFSFLNNPAMNLLNGCVTLRTNNIRLPMVMLFIEAGTYRRGYIINWSTGLLEHDVSRRAGPRQPGKVTVWDTYNISARSTKGQCPERMLFVRFSTWDMVWCLSYWNRWMNILFSFHKMH
jgi:hypothetical protein